MFYSPSVKKRRCVGIGTIIVFKKTVILFYFFIRSVFGSVYSLRWFTVLIKLLFLEGVPLVLWWVGGVGILSWAFLIVGI